MKRTRAIRLLLLTSMPAMLAACSDDNLYDRYTRRSFPSMAECLEVYARLPLLTEPCVYNDGTVYGPYEAEEDDDGRTYLGYRGGKLSGHGVKYHPRKGFASVLDPELARGLSARGTTRGGFGTTGRSSGFSSGG